MNDTVFPYQEPFTSTSRAVFALPYLGEHNTNDDDDDQDDGEYSSYPPRSATSMYSTAWESCHARIQKTLSTLHDASLDQIVTFVHSPPNERQVMFATLSGLEQLKTGLIIGAAPGSSSLLFSALCKELSGKGKGKGKEKENESTTTTTTTKDDCLIARIASRDCSNIKSCLRVIISNFIGSVDDEDLDDEGGEGEGGAELFASRHSKGKMSALAPEDLDNLKAWYEWRYSKRAKEGRPKLILLLEDLEAMDGKVLTQMIESLSPYATSLSLVLLIGIATSSNALHDIVPRTTTNLLSLNSFFVEPGVRAFIALIRGVFFDWMLPLGLGPDVYEYVWKSFLEHNHSIDAVISSIQYLYMHHYTTSPYCISSSPNPDISHLLASPSTILSLPSIKSLLASEPDSPVSQLLSSVPPNLEEAIHLCLEEKEAWSKERKMGLVVLETLQGAFESKGLTMEVILEEIELGFVMERVKKICQMIQQTSSLKLPQLLSVLLKKLKALISENEDLPTTLLEDITMWSEEMERLNAVPRKGRQNLINLNILGNKESKYDKVDEEFSKLCEKVSKELRRSLRRAFRLSTSLPLHELFVITSPDPLHSAFHPSFLPSYHRALQEAQDLTTTSEKQGVGLDIAYLYKGFQESGSRVVNLGDMWVQFEGNVASEMRGGTAGMGKGKGKKRRRGEVDMDVDEDVDEESEEDEEEEGEEEEEDEEEEGRKRRKQARFLRSVGDLAMAGYFVPNTRRPEHISKNVFYPTSSDRKE